MNRELTIVGAGLAGSEAALQLAKRGWNVRLIEMRPLRQTPAHQTGMAAELVCSNSLKSTRLDTGSGMLKAELKLLDCELLAIAEKARVPAAHALAVDRTLFSQYVEEQLASHTNITRVNQEVTDLPAGNCLIAAGPLASDALIASLRKLIGEEHLYFFDAIAPIVDAQSLDLDKVFAKARYDKGDADYLNCPFDKEQYEAFVDALLSGEQFEAHEFENEFFAGIDFSYYENCTPIEELARRGRDTLRHGVMRPMGLEDPHTGKKPYAVLQLRSENKDFTAYNIVGAQTMLRQAEQKRIFRLIPGLENASFLRYGSIHRNAYLDAPKVLNPDLSLKSRSDVWIAGQLAGWEGYVESIAGGLFAALIIDKSLPALPEESMTGQLLRRLTSSTDRRFQPINANFGLLPALKNAPRDKRLKRQMLADRGVAALEAVVGEGLIFR